MTTFRLSYELHVDRFPSTKDLNVWATAVFDQVCYYDEIDNADLEGTLTTGDIKITFDVDAPSVDAAVDRATDIFHAALRASEGYGMWHQDDRGTRRLSAEPVPA